MKSVWSLQADGMGGRSLLNKGQPGAGFLKRRVLKASQQGANTSDLCLLRRRERNRPRLAAGGEERGGRWRCARGSGGPVSTAEPGV